MCSSPPHVLHHAVQQSLSPSVYFVFSTAADMVSKSSTDVSSVTSLRASSTDSNQISFHRHTMSSIFESIGTRDNSESRQFMHKAGIINGSLTIISARCVQLKLMMVRTIQYVSSTSC
jgi:hypothetical protein